MVKTSLFKSRKFRIMVGDVVVSLILYFSAKYLAPSIVADIKFLIAALQPVIIFVINGIAKEDAAAKSNPSFHTGYTPLVVE